MKRRRGRGRSLRNEMDRKTKKRQRFRLLAEKMEKKKKQKRASPFTS
jgi:hypothetical protein